MTAVAGLSLRAEPAQVTAILGPNGAGKTTTIETCEGYRTPDAGTVRFLGLDPIANGRELRPKVGVMLQAGGVPTSVRAGEYLRVMASFYAHPLDPAALLATLGLADSARTSYKHLSGGQQQRLSLAAAVIGRPELVFLDEPTAGLDPQARHATWELHRRPARGRSRCDFGHALHGRGRAAGGQGCHRRPGSGRGRRLPRRAHRVARRAAIPGRGRPRHRRAARRAAARLSRQGTPAGHYLVEVADRVDPQLLASVTAWCAEHGVLARDLQIECRTLEDLFLELTGRGLR